MDKTTLLTVLGIVGGLLNQVASGQVALPTNRQEAANLGVSVIIGALGYLAQGAKSARPE